MKAIDLRELAGLLGGDLLHQTPDSPPVTGVSTDSRSVEPGDLYVAIRGERHDGHNFVAQALREGAAGCLVDRHYARQPDSHEGPLLAVRDTIAALGRWARWARENASYRVVGVTGSAGKTTTRHMMAHVLGQHQPVWQSPRNYNNLIGLPLTLLRAPGNARMVVAELGTNQPGEIAELTLIAQPDIAVVTLAAPAHLEGFGTLEAIVDEKLSIQRGLQPGGVLYVNGDCQPLMDGCRQRGLARATYGIDPSTQITATEIVYHSEGSTFCLEGINVQIPLPGPANVLNALACWAVCRHLGISTTALAAGLADLPPVTMRGECMQYGSLTVLNDCYNANPASMGNALQTLALLDATEQRRRVFVCGAMMELGTASERLHRELGPAIAAAGVDLVLAAGPLAALAAEAAQTLRAEIQICRYKDGDTLCASFVDEINETDLILVKGSRSARLEQVVAVLKERFSPKASLLATNE